MYCLKVFTLFSIIIASLACETTTTNVNPKCERDCHNHRNLDFSQVPRDVAIEKVRQSAQKLIQYILTNAIEPETKAVLFSPIDTVLSMSHLMINSVTKNNFWSNILSQSAEQSTFSLKAIFKIMKVVAGAGVYFSRRTSVYSPVLINLDKEYFNLSNVGNSNVKMATLKTNVHIHLDAIPLVLEHLDKY